MAFNIFFDKSTTVPTNFSVFDRSRFFLHKHPCLAKIRTGATEKQENVLEPPQ